MVQADVYSFDYTAPMQQSCNSPLYLSRRWLIKELLSRVDRHIEVPYRSLYSFRHVYIQYGVTHSTNLGDFKVASMNLMNSDISTTYEIHDRLKEEDIHARMEILAINGDGYEGLDENEVRVVMEFSDWLKTTK